MSQATPEFVITNVGLATASVADPQGPYIHIVGMKIGSAFGYTPDPSQSALQGTLQYSGQVLSWQSIGDNTLDIVITIPPEAGPFQFGEVALYLADSNGVFSDDSAMFAIAVFDDVQTKFSSLGTNVITSYTFHCLLKLEQSVAVFQIDTSGYPPSVIDVYQWSDVYPPGASANPDLPLQLIRELDAFGESSLISNTSDAEWSVASSNYERYLTRTNGPTFAVANASNSWIEVLATSCHPADLTTTNRRFLIRTADGFFRSVSSVATSGSNYRFNLNVTNDGTYANFPLPNVPTVGSAITIFRDDQRGGTIYYSQIVDPPVIALATPGVPGLATSGQGTYLPASGVIGAAGMLQSPSAGTGRLLTSADNLNSFALASGLYYTTAAAGYPANMPFSYAAMIWVHNANGLGGGSDMVQIAYPMNTGGGDGSGVNGLPPYWRQGFNGNAFTTWEPFLVKGKAGGAAVTVVTDMTYYNSPLSTGSSITTNGNPGLAVMVFNTDGNPGASQTMYINGVVVGIQSKQGGAGYGRKPTLIGNFPAGATIAGTNTAGSTFTLILYYYE